jgi:hypothetical protein
MTDDESEASRKAKVRSRSRQPITDAEVSYLKALGSEVSRPRKAAGLTTADLDRRADVSPEQARNIQGGTRRTRRSTLARIAETLVDPRDELGDRDTLLKRLRSVAGPGSAEESRSAEHLGDNRRRRALQRERPEGIRAFIEEYKGQHLRTCSWCWGARRVPDKNFLRREAARRAALENGAGSQGGRGWTDGRVARTTAGPSHPCCRTVCDG